MLGQGPYAEMDLDTAREVLAEIERLAKHELAASFVEADRNPPVFDPEAHEVAMPEAFKKSYHAYMDAEWCKLELPAELGGQPTPAVAALGRRRAGAGRQPGGAHVRRRPELRARALAQRHRAGQADRAAS